jgi:hypothetical protein
MTPQCPVHHRVALKCLRGVLVSKIFKSVFIHNYTIMHHHTPPCSGMHHHAPWCLRPPPYTAVLLRTPPNTTIHLLSACALRLLIPLAVFCASCSFDKEQSEDGALRYARPPVLVLQFQDKRDEEVPRCSLPRVQAAVRKDWRGRQLLLRIRFNCDGAPPRSKIDISNRTAS